MATKAQLEAEGRSLAKKISDIQANAEMTGAEKSAALDAVRPDYEAHIASVKASEAASEMTAKLAGGGDAKDADGNSISHLETIHPFSREARKALALSFVDSKTYKDVAAKGKHEFDRGIEVDVKDATQANNLMGDLIYGGTGPSAIGQNVFGAGAFAPALVPTFLPGMVEKLFYELTIADLISSIPVSTPNISYLTESTLNMQANQVAEGATYPFSSVEVSRVYEQIGKVANAMTLTDEAIADAAQLFNHAQGRLLLGLQRQEEVQILAGGGYPGVNGLLGRASSFTASGASSLFGATSATGTNVVFPPAGTNGAGVQGQTISSLAYGREVTGATTGAYPLASPLAENLFDSFVDIELAVFQSPNAIVMHPRDFETLRLAKDDNGQYFGGSFFGNNYGVGGNAGKTLWGKPVVTTPLMPQHSILVGWFDPSTIQVARRDNVSLQMTNSNGTEFVEGKVTVRAEERLGLLVYRPAAFQLVHLAAGA